MPFLNELCLVVNQELRKGALSEQRFQSGRYEGVSNEVTRGNQVFPCIINNNRESNTIECSPDDTYPIVIYHKVLAKRYELNNIAGQRSEFGDRNKYVKETALVKMVVYGKWSALNLKKEELEAIITSNFPDNMDNQNNALLNSLKIDNVTYAMQSTNFLSQSVWNEEYKNVDFSIDTEDLYFAITYQIQSTWRKGCFQLCNCDYYLLAENGEIINTENNKHLKT